MRDAEALEAIEQLAWLGVGLGVGLGAGLGVGLGRGSELGLGLVGFGSELGFGSVRVRFELESGSEVGLRRCGSSPARSGSSAAMERCSCSQRKPTTWGDRREIVGRWWGDRREIPSREILGGYHLVVIVAAVLIYSYSWLITGAGKSEAIAVVLTPLLIYRLGLTNGHLPARGRARRATSARRSY